MLGDTIDLSSGFSFVTDPTTAAGCVVGGLDANGNTIANCPPASLPAGTSPYTAPTCMPGDTLSKSAAGVYSCVGPWIPGVSNNIVIGVGIVALLGLFIAGSRR